jgi:hypothetical protein
MRQIILVVATIAIVLNGYATQAAQVFDIAQGRQPRIAVDTANNVHVVFEGYSEGSDFREILYSKSSDMAKTWTVPLNISRTARVSTLPAIAVEKSGAIDVVWRDTSSGELHPDIYFTRSVDWGQTWTKALDISHTTGICSEPAIAAGPDNSIHVVWVDTRPTDGRPDVFYSCSTDGKTWSPCVSISPTPGISSEPTIIACKDGTVHCSWLDTTSGEERPDIFYVRKANNVWTAPIDVSNTPKMSDHPWLACGSKGKIFLCWVDYSQKVNAPDIWCAIGRNGRFDKPINISDTPGVSSKPVVVADEAGRVSVVWSDSSLKLSKPDIYARVSADNGDDFSNVLYLTHTDGVSVHPAVTLLGNRMILLWEDVVGSIASIKGTVFDFKGIGTGPVDQVNPTVRRPNSNSH